MEAKKKAKELVDRFKDKVMGDMGGVIELFNAKQCALICVNEMIQSHIDWSTEQLEVLTELNKVKAEIEKL